MHQIIKPQVMMPTTSAAIHELTQRSMMRSVWLVVPRSVGSHPFCTSGEHPVKANAPASAKPVIEVICLRRLPVRFCELTDGPSYLLLSPGRIERSGHTKSFTTRCRAYRSLGVFAHMSAPWSGTFFGVSALGSPDGTMAGLKARPLTLVEGVSAGAGA